MVQGATALLLTLAAASGSPTTSLPSGSPSKYDIVILGTGLKESLLAGLLSSHGKQVLQLEPSEQLGGRSRSLDLRELADETGALSVALPEQKLGKPADYLIELEPKMFMAAGNQLQLLINSGAWQHMTPPGFKRVQRSFIFRQRPDGSSDVHRVLANSEDVVKTRMLAPLDKARVLQFFHWIERYDEDDVRTHASGPLSKRELKLHKMSAAKFLAFWELPAEASQMIVRGMALHSGPQKSLKRLPAIEFVRKLKRYKDGYRTFPHMTSPYVYPVGGFGSTLAKAMTGVVEANDGSCILGQAATITEDGGSACGVTLSDGTSIQADCVVASPECAPERVQQSYKVVRLYAVLAHAPNLCKDASSCQLIIPAAHTGREHDIYLMSVGPTHGVAPKGKWVVVASTRIEGDAEGDALALAKRELATVLPLLKPSRKLFAEVKPYYEPVPEAQIGGLHVLSSVDEATHLDSVEADVEGTFQSITGESIASLRRPS